MYGSIKMLHLDIPYILWFLDKIKRKATASLGLNE